MGWLRNRLVFPDDAWEEAARKLDGEFVKGRWLANSEIRLLHRNHPITLDVEFGADDDSTQYTRAVPHVALDPSIKLEMLPQVKGLLGPIVSGLAARTVATIKIPALGEDYFVLGDDEELANNILGHRDFLSALSGLTQNPRVFVGQTSSVDLLADETEQDEDNFYVSVRGVLKDIHQLAALADLTRVLLDVLDENGCLSEAGS